MLGVIVIVDVIGSVEDKAVNDEENH